MNMNSSSKKFCFKWGAEKETVPEEERRIKGLESTSLRCDTCIRKFTSLGWKVQIWQMYVSTTTIKMEKFLSTSEISFVPHQLLTPRPRQPLIRFMPLSRTCVLLVSPKCHHTVCNRFVSGWLCSARCFWGFTMLVQEPELTPFLVLSSIPWRGNTTVCLSSHLLIDTEVVSSLRFHEKGYYMHACLSLMCILFFIQPCFFKGQWSLELQF